MKQFSLVEYLANPSRKVVTRDGRSARIICTDKISECPIVALVKKTDGTEKTLSYLKDGKYLMNGASSEVDLFFAPEKHEGYASICFCDGEYHLDDIIYSSAKEAKINAGMYGDFVTAVKIEWEE